MAMQGIRRFFNLDKKREDIKTEIQILGSQGIRCARDKTAAYIHESTSPPTYYLCSYGVTGINMDRGGVGQARNGTNFACIFDGVTSGGKINAFAAQAFTDFMMDWLYENHAALAQGTEAQIVDMARAAFHTATLPQYNPGREDPDRQAEGGSATGAIIAFDKGAGGMALLRGASIGDAAVITVRSLEGIAHQLNPVYRKHDRDNGGQMTMCFGVDGHVWAFESELRGNEFVVLATDGLTDNVSQDEFDRIIPLLMSARAFDAPMLFDCEVITRDPPERPTLTFLRGLVGGNVDAADAITCEAAARRLFNYVEWVTRSYHRQEEVYYSIMMKLKQAPDEATRTELQEEITRMSVARKASKKVCKTDDAMIIVMRPFHDV